MKISFMKYPNKQGVKCDNCGTYIENVYTIEVGSQVFNIGTECFKNLQEKTNLSDYGKKWLLKKKTKNINLRIKIDLLKKA